MRLSMLAPLLGLPLGFACAGGPTPQRFGAPLVLSSERTVSVEELLAAPERFDGQTLAFEGRVGDVCPKKGCWMTLSSAGREMRVTFQDYGFFVPLDSQGSTVRAEGLFRIEETPLAEARHYLEDAGKHAEAEALTAPVKGFTFVASGVELVRL